MKCYDKECKSRDMIHNKELVLIRWHDASYQEGPIYIEDIDKDYIIDSVGFLIAEGDGHITLGMDWYKLKNYWRRVIHIPKGMIKDLWRFDIPKEAL